MKVFVFLSQKTIKVQFSKFRKEFYLFIYLFILFFLSQTINMGKKKSTSKAQKRSLYVKMLFSAKVKNK